MEIKENIEPNKTKTYKLIIGEISKEIFYQIELGKFGRYNRSYLKKLLIDVIKIKNHLFNGFLDKCQVLKLNEIFYNFFLKSFYELPSVKEDLYLEIKSNLNDNDLSEIYKDVIRAERNIANKSVTLEDILILKQCFYTWILDEEEINDNEDNTYLCIKSYIIDN